MQIIPIPREVSYSDKTVTPSKTVTKEDAALGAEEYLLTVSDDGTVTVTSGGDAGAFYAQQTLRQLRKEYGEVLPVCRIHDQPRFAHRGFLLDCARHMIEIDEIKKIIDAMALMKYNRFHWHLTDDQGWRIESGKHPELNTLSAVRYGDRFGKKKDDAPYGRVYTKAEIREIVSYCAERFMEVIPEFDMPGHTSALMAGRFKELSCKDEMVSVKLHQGIFKDVLCLAKPFTFEYVCSILDEICALFPSEYIHIGGDEVPADHWKECPDCQAKMKALGITDFKAYQNEFMNRVIAYLESKGKTCIVWNDAVCAGNLYKSAVVQYWKENDKASIAFANNGGRLILSPFSYYYFDYDYDITPLNRVLSFNPMLKGLKDESSITGLEITLWTEYIETPEQLEKMLFPRVAAAAQTAWGDSVDYKHFLMAFPPCRTLLEESGIRFADCWLWKGKRLQMPLGWLKFVRQHYSFEYIRWALK